jgi:hypothetical protein
LVHCYSFADSVAIGDSGPGYDFRRYKIFYVAVGLERGPFNSCEDK